MFVLETGPPRATAGPGETFSRGPSEKKIFFMAHSGVDLHCVSKNILDIFDSNLKTKYQILIIFGTNISDTTCRHKAI